ncbi:hypothetical protein [Pseudalkalibacillus caeni]|uniref:Uncharacterized protein n=1 Tax=Exobacillus caeni TaxID=2574798 RepID=A0A5R9F3H1_9BACL|nr:hypothetical protein [Pseudalkalibacillus caeni]TLS38157.1 hypothetical protein FCL54_06345 [Pseudalkalibacillus caeni]
MLETNTFKNELEKAKILFTKAKADSAYMKEFQQAIANVQTKMDTAEGAVKNRINAASSELQKEFKEIKADYESLIDEFEHYPE